MTLTAFDPAASAAETHLEALEAKIHKTLEKLAQARDENARLRQLLAEREQQIQLAQRERQDVRGRVEKLLKQVDAMTRDE